MVGGHLRERTVRGGVRYALGRLVPASATDIELVLREAEAGPLVNEDVRRLLGTDARAARRILRRLVEQGRLTQVGERRGTRYVLPGGKG